MPETLAEPVTGSSENDMTARLIELPRNGDFPLQGFTVSVRGHHCLAIECPAGCKLEVLAGRAWITVEGAPRDLIAEAGDTLPLSAGLRAHVSALYGTTTVMVTVPGRFHDAAFSLATRGGTRVLTVGVGTSRWRSAASRLVRLAAAAMSWHAPIAAPEIGVSR